MESFITGADLREMFLSAAALVDMNQQKINDLNVFPVPDGDTGTNMALTLGNAAKELRKRSQTITVTECADVAAAALLRGARGNSGVITSLLFRGFSKYMKDHTTANGTDFAYALKEGVEAAYKAVMKPAEGTILTVSRVSAESAIAASEENSDIEPVLSAAIESAKQALDQTVEQNPVLKKAGVVDSGGKGFVFILEAFDAALHGEKIEMPEGSQTEAPYTKTVADFDAISDEEITYSYCTEFIVSRQNDRDPELLRQFLSGLGDCLVLVDDDEIIKVHIHTDNPGTAMQEALKYGYFETVKVENMRLQHSEKIFSQEEIKNSQKKASERQIAPPEQKYGFVAVCTGKGVEDMFHDLGVGQIVSGGQTMNPSTEDILKKVDATPAENVMILPNNKNIQMAAEQCKPLSEKNVIVIPTATIPEGITAMVNFNESSSLKDNLREMQNAIKKVTTMQITYAARDSDFDGKDIHAGDYLALTGKTLSSTSRDIQTALQMLAEEAKSLSPEFVTIFYGEDIPAAEAEKADQIFKKACPDAEVTTVYGGQPVYYYLISCE